MKKILLLAAISLSVNCKQEESAKQLTIWEKIKGVFSGPEVKKSSTNLLNAVAKKAEAEENGDAARAIRKAVKEMDEETAAVEAKNGMPAGKASESIAEAIDRKVEAEGGYDKFRDEFSKAVDKAAREIEEDTEKLKNKK